MTAPILTARAPPTASHVAGVPGVKEQDSEVVGHVGAEGLNALLREPA